MNKCGSGFGCGDSHLFHCAGNCFGHLHKKRLNSPKNEVGWLIPAQTVAYIVVLFTAESTIRNLLKTRKTPR